MTVEKGQKYTRKSKTYTVVSTNSTIHFTYIVVLKDGLEDTLDNRRVFGITAFENEFKFIKETDEKKD